MRFFSGWEISFVFLFGMATSNKHTRVKLISTDGDRDGERKRLRHFKNYKQKCLIVALLFFFPLIVKKKLDYNHEPIFILASSIFYS